MLGFRTMGFLGLVACSGGETADTGTVEATACGGAGAATIQLGEGGRSGFTAWEDGDAVQIRDDGTGRYGFDAQLLSSGLDTEAPIITFLRFTTGSEPETQDVGANLQFQCPEEGPGYTAVFAPLADAWQDATAVATLEGVALGITALATDQAEETAQVSLDLVYRAP